MTRVFILPVSKVQSSQVILGSSLSPTTSNLLSDLMTPSSTSLEKNGANGTLDEVSPVGGASQQLLRWELPEARFTEEIRAFVFYLIYLLTHDKNFTDEEEKIKSHC